MSHVFEQPLEDRAATADELAVIRAALERAAAAPELQHLTASLLGLWVESRCGCGCDSVNFRDPGSERSKPVAHAIGKTPQGGEVGVIVWGTNERVTGLEIYDLGAGPDDLRLPRPESVVPWERGSA